jgi:AraC-like DNA-binding protein
MKRIFSTDGLPARDRYDSWHEVIRKRVIDHDSVPDCRLAFEATLDVADVADLSLISFEVGSLAVSHERRHFEASAEELILVRQVRGGLTLEHNGREVSIDPGHMTLIDPRMTYSARLAADSSVLVVKFPRRNLIARVGRPDSFIACQLKPERGEIGLLSQLLDILPQHTENLDATASRVADQVLDLMAVALSKSGGGSVPRVSSPRAVLGMQLRAAVDRFLNDHTITSESIARSAGISLRYANAILRDEDTSVGRLLQSRRLERCRQVLADPMQLQRTISSIAFAWGFSDMTHFGRCFRKSFGLLPSEYRRLYAKPSITGFPE